MLRIADVAGMCGMNYKDFYALIWTKKISAPTHPVPLMKKKRYTAEEAAEIVQKVRDYKQAVAK
jgi:hypothetical protein